MDINGSKDEQKAINHQNHLNYNITVKIPVKTLRNSQNGLQVSPQDSQVSTLPLNSARVVTVGSKKRRINSQAKFIHVADDAISSSLSQNRIKKIKNVVFRPKLQTFISEEKTRLAALQQTMMFQRQRRLNKQQCIKKIQRLMSPTTIKERNQKKFIRTQDKINDENKKFKRIKDKQQPSQEQKLLQAKLIKKLRQEQKFQGLSRIAEHFEESYAQTMIKPNPQSYPSSQIPQMLSQNSGQSFIEQQPAIIIISDPTDQK